jgi:cell fate regulator YaaT (PSP1 superfamily)
MPIVPLPVFEADADPRHRSAMSDEEIYARLEAPKTIVIRFGHLKHVAEYPYDGEAKPGCGSKLVARTHRGTEVVEMLTTTCSNSGCGKSISRREMLDYIDNSGGKEYPFTTKGRIIRVATIEDLNAQSALESTRREAVKLSRGLVAELRLGMKVVDAEPILGGETLTFYYMSEHRVDFRELVQRLAARFTTRIEMRQVGARDEARIVADYERCGQHCCCKNFLKVLKPVSMRQAKVQKATLDPLKISGRCGRLMCCLRYEDQTYKELKANLPHRNTRVGTAEGPGVVVDSKILVQLVLVRLEHDMREIAVPVEELMDPNACPKPRSAMEAALAEGQPGGGGAGRRDRDRSRQPREQRPQDKERRPRDARAERSSGATPPVPGGAPIDDPLRGLGEADAAERAGEGPKRKRRRRRKRRGGSAGDGADNAGSLSQQRTPSEPDRHRQQDAYRAMAQHEDEDAPEKSHDGGHDSGNASGSAGSAEAGSAGQAQEGRRRRRRRRRRRSGGDGNSEGGPGTGADGGSPSTH